MMVAFATLHSMLPFFAGATEDTMCSACAAAQRQRTCLAYMVDLVEIPLGGHCNEFDSLWVSEVEPGL